MPINMTAFAFFILLFYAGVSLMWDSWYSLLHYQRTEETFWRNNIFRWHRLIVALILIYMGIYFGVRML